MSQGSSRNSLRGQGTRTSTYTYFDHSQRSKYTVLSSWVITHILLISVNFMMMQNHRWTILQTAKIKSRAGELISAFTNTKTCTLTQSMLHVCFEHPAIELCKCQNRIKQVYSTNSTAWAHNKKAHTPILQCCTLHIFIMPNIVLINTYWHNYS